MLTIVPCSIAQANAYIEQHHRHHQPVTASRFALAVADESGLVRGVAIVGLPVARMYCPPREIWTAEVRRVATDGCKNACSILYAAAWRASSLLPRKQTARSLFLFACLDRKARNIGYKRLITYTLTTESGASLRAAGWHQVARCRARSWDMPGRRRKETPVCAISKWRWEICEKRPAFDKVVFE